MLATQSLKNKTEKKNPKQITVGVEPNPSLGWIWVLAAALRPFPAPGS